MFNRKSIYALNKKDPNALVYTDADGNLIRLTRDDFASEEEFLYWKTSYSYRAYLDSHEPLSGSAQYSAYSSILSMIASQGGHGTPEQSFHAHPPTAQHQAIFPASAASASVADAGFRVITFWLSSSPTASEAASTPNLATSGYLPRNHFLMVG